MTPTRRLLVVMLPLVVAVLIMEVLQWNVALLFYAGLLLFVVALVDAWQLWRAPKPSCERIVDAQIPVHERIQASIKIYAEPNSSVDCLVHDDIPDAWQAFGLPQRVRLGGDDQQLAKVEYAFVANHRGESTLETVDLLICSRYKLWEQRIQVPVTSKIKVQPNYKKTLDLALLGNEQRIALLGARQQRRRGEGTEFHQLREYHAGDPMRKIDWKASSRIGKLISKEFQDEQDQQLVFLIDTGRRMRHKDNQSDHLDEVLNAMLLVAHSASQQGDAVGFLSFGNQNKWCPPRKHPAIVKHLVDHCFDLKTGLVMSDYLLAAQSLLELQKRRALVMILTNSRDEDREDLEKAIVLLRKKHLVVVADLQESFISKLQNAPVKTFDQALTFTSMQDYVRSRDEMHRSLNRLGATCLDCEAKSLPQELLINYQQMKHAGKL